MKINNILLVSIFLLAIMTLGAVSAAGEADNLTVSDDAGDAIEAPAGEMEVIADDGDDYGEKEDIDDMYGYFENNDIYEGYPATYKICYDYTLFGNVSISIDGVEYLNDEIESYHPYELDTSKLPEGEYNMTVSFSGDYNYNPYSYVESMTILGLFDTPEESFDIGEFISINLPDYATGYISAYMNGTQILNQSIYDENGEFMGSGFNLDNVSCGVYNFTVSYSGDGNCPPATKSIIVEIGYSIYAMPRSEFDQESIVFGDKNVIDLLAPNGIDWNKITVKINGTEYPVVINDELHYIDIENLTSGTYTVTMAYSGDERYYPLQVNMTFEIIYAPKMDAYMDYGEDKNITFALPNAKGDFVVILNKKEFARVKFNDGIAVVPLNEVAPGEYDVEFKYVGDDYANIDLAGEDLRVYAIFIMPESQVTVADKLNVTLIMPKDTVGKLMVAIDGDYDNPLEAPIKDGIAVLPLNLKMSEFNFELYAYYSENETRCFWTSSYIYVGPVKSEWDRYVSYDEPAVFSFEMPKDAKGNYILCIDDEIRYNKTLTNGIANVTIDDLKPGSYDVYIEYDGDDYGYWRDSGWLTVGPKESYREKIDIGDENYFALELPGYKGNLSYTVRYEAGSDGSFSKSVPFDSFINITLDGSKASLMSIDYSLSSEDGPDFSDMRYIRIMQTPVMSIAAEDVYEGEDVKITVTIDGATFGEDFTITVLNKTTTYQTDDGKTTKNITLSDLKSGEYPVFAQLNESTFVRSANATHTFKVLAKTTPELNITVDDIFVGEDALVNIVMDDAFSGKVKVNVSNKLYSVSVKDGKGNVSVKNLIAGSYDVKAYFDGNRTVNAVQSFASFKVSKAEIPEKDIKFEEDNKTDSQSYSVTLPEDATGILTVKVNNKTYTAEVKNGKATVDVGELPAGDYTIDISYSGDAKYASSSKTVNKTVAPKPYQDASIVPASINVYVGENITLSAMINENATGKLIFRLNNTNYTAEIINGSASVNIPSMDKNTYDVIVIYEGDDIVLPASANATLTVEEMPLPPVIFEPKIVAKNMVAWYTNKAKFQVTVYLNNESIAANTPVTFKVKKDNIVNTSSAGKAALTLYKRPGVYKVTVKALGISATYKVTFKHLVTLKKVTVKKSAKKLVLTAKLKKGKHIIKYKKVTFKFNGKTYKTKTNKYGIAKITIKKSVLKKLKVGKKVTYQARFLNDIVKKTVKVKK